MIHKHSLDELQNGVKSLLAKGGYAFSEEDKTLLDYYNELLDRGTYFVNEKRLKKYFKTFQFKDKRDDIIGLQITDLVAYPITRFVLDKDAVNLSFEIIKDKIYAQNNIMHGLKIHPI